MEQTDTSEPGGPEGQTTDCPVCLTPNIPPESATCPACHTDLGPLRRLADLARADFNEALALARAGATDAAIVRAAAAVTNDGRLIVARKLLGKLLWKVGRRSEALVQWQQAAELAPDDAELHGLLRRADRARPTRTMRIVTATALAGAVLLCATALALFHSDRTAERLAKLTVTVAELASDKSTSNEKLAGDIRRLERRAQEAEDRARHALSDLAKLREAKRQSDVRLVELDESLRGVGQSLELIRTQLASQRRANASLSKQLRARDQQQRDFIRDSLTAMLDLMKRADSSKLDAEAHELNGRIALLTSLADRYNDSGTSQADAERKKKVAAELAQARKQLETLEPRRRARLVPWEQAAKDILAGTRARAPVSPQTPSDRPDKPRAMPDTEKE